MKKFPRHSKKNDGWELDYSSICEVRDAGFHVDAADCVPLYEEEIEITVLALAKLGYLELEEE